jgi:tetratricopeptide (TPR) repeat protein
MADEEDHFPRKILCLMRLLEHWQAKGESPLSVIQLKEKLVLGTLMGLENKSLKFPPFDVVEQAADLAQSMDRFLLEAPDRSHHAVVAGKLLLLSKNREIRRLARQSALGTALEQALNNLACQFRGWQLYPEAYKLLVQAEEFEQPPAKGNAKTRLVSRLNKAAVLSSLGRHERALNELRYCRKLLGLAEERELEADLLYSMGAEYEHMRLLESALKKYKGAFGAAGSDGLRKKAHLAMLSLMQQRLA